MPCQHSKLRRYNRGAWECVEEGCNFVIAQPLPLHSEIDISDDSLRELWSLHGGEFHGPHVETGTMPEAVLLPFLRSVCTGVPVAKNIDGTIRDTREAAAERERFEMWAKSHTDTWPNPDTDGSRVYPDGTYRNKSLHERWLAWQAATDALEVDARAHRIEFAANALIVAENIRDNLRQQLRDAQKRLEEQPQFVVLRGCRPGDVVFLAPRRDLSAEELNRVCAMFKHFTNDLGIKIVVLPGSFSVHAKDAGEEPQSAGESLPDDALAALRSAQVVES